MVARIISPDRFILLGVEDSWSASNMQNTRRSKISIATAPSSADLLGLSVRQGGSDLPSTCVARQQKIGRVTTKSRLTRCSVLHPLLHGIRSPRSWFTIYGFLPLSYDISPFVRMHSATSSRALLIWRRWSPPPMPPAAMLNFEGHNPNGVPEVCNHFIYFSWRRLRGRNSIPCL